MLLIPTLFASQTSLAEDFLDELHDAWPPRKEWRTRLIQKAVHHGHKVIMKAFLSLQDGWSAALGRKAFGLLSLNRPAGDEGAASHRQSRLRLRIP